VVARAAVALLRSHDDPLLGRCPGSQLDLLSTRR
jgi:hypothetical protein